MKTKRRFVVALAVLLGLSIAFAMAPRRIQGRAVECLTLGDWPLEWAVRRHFEDRQPDLQTIVGFLQALPHVDGLTISAVGLNVRLQADEYRDEKLDRPDILDALVSVDAQFVSNKDDGVWVFLGSERRGRTLFEVSYLLPPQTPDAVMCDKMTSSARAASGECVMPLSARWHLHYAWYPIDPGEWAGAESP